MPAIADNVRVHRNVAMRAVRVVSFGKVGRPKGRNHRVPTRVEAALEYPSRRRPCRRIAGMARSYSSVGRITR